MKPIYKLILIITILQVNIFALSMSKVTDNRCINSESIVVNWTSFKTLSKIPVGGIFDTVKLNIKNNNARTIPIFLKDIEVDIDLESINANDEFKNI